MFQFKQLTVRVTSAAVAIAASFIVGCSKSDAPPPRSTAAPAPSNAPLGSDAPTSSPRKSVDYMAGLKDIKDQNKAVTKEEMVRSSQQVVEAAQAAKGGKPAEAPKQVETKAAPQPAASTASAAAPVAAAPAPTPAKPAAPADNIIAKAAPSSAPGASAAPTPLTREAPEFPREAIRSGVDSGSVRARLSIDGSGNVTNVQIVEARPARVFDRSVRDTLSRWKFNTGADGRSYETEVEFKR